MWICRSDVVACVDEEEKALIQSHEEYSCFAGGLDDGVFLWIGALTYLSVEERVAREMAVCFWSRTTLGPFFEAGVGIDELPCLVLVLVPGALCSFTLVMDMACFRSSLSACLVHAVCLG